MSTSHSHSQSIFVIGPGLIGWTLLEQLVAAAYTNITTLVRREEHGAAIQKVTSEQIKILTGDLNDHDLISSTAAEHDVTFHTATADHLPSAQAVLDGIQRRTEKGLGSIYIHTSGASLLADSTDTDAARSKIYSDTDAAAIDALDPKQPHREIDLAIVNFSRRQTSPNVKIAIMIPPLIYGYNASHDRLTIQIPTLARFALKHGYAGYALSGNGISGAIHVTDLVRGYLTILSHFLGSATSSTSEDDDVAASFRANPYIFAENGVEYTWREVAEKVGQSLAERGLLQSSETRQIPQTEWSGLFGADTPAVVGMTARSRADRLRKLGWESKEGDMWSSWTEHELPALLKKDGRA